MVKKIIAVMMILNMILFSLNIVNAATGNADINASNTSVKPGETFTVTISAKCDDGINGIDTTYSYDIDKLELVSANVTNNNWVNMGSDNTIQVICNTTKKVTSDNIYILTFKVKDNVAEETTVKISTSDIKVDSDVSKSSFTESAKSVNINIVPTNSNVQNNNNDENQGTNVPNSNNGQNQSQNPSTQNSSNQNNSNGQSQNQNSSTQTSNNQQNKTPNTQSNNSETKVTDKSVSNKSMPKTGKANITLTILIILFSICSIIAYIKMIKNK